MFICLIVKLTFMSDITLFAETNYRGQEQRFGIKKDDRRRHMYLIGKTGMGKTTMLEHLVYSDIISGNGLALVDPHGDFAEKMLDFIPSSRINDVIYFNPADIDWPIAFNVMEKVDPRYISLVASGLIGVFKKIWADSWGPRLEYLLRNTILALLEYPGSTLLGVPRMLVDKTYRAKVIKKVNDPVVKAFWVDEFSKYSSQFTVDAISPIQNKVGQFLSNPLVRNIVSQTKSAIDLRKIMDEKKILIINLSKGRVGEDYSALLGAMMITKIQLAAMGRVDIPESERNDFYLYVDEFQNFATESFANILSEARKYHLNLIIAHQYIGQLVAGQNTVVRDAVFGNVGTIVTFRVGAADAEYLEKEFEPVFMMNDLVNLPKYNVYMKLMIDGVTSDAFSAVTLPPLNDAAKENNQEKIIKNSRQRYATERSVIEDKIMKWSGMEGGDDSEGIVKTAILNGAKNIEPKKYNNATEDSKPVKIDNAVLKTENTEEKKPKWQNRGVLEDDGREWYDAICQKCNKPIKVPFKPDPARKTFCRECLKENRSVQQKNLAYVQKPGAGKNWQAGGNFPPKMPSEANISASVRPAAASAIPSFTRKTEVKTENKENFISIKEAMKAGSVNFPAKKQIFDAKTEEARYMKPVSQKKEEAEEEAGEASDIENKKTPLKGGTVFHSGTIKPREKARFE